MTSIFFKADSILDGLLGCKSLEVELEDQIIWTVRFFNILFLVNRFYFWLPQVFIATNLVFSSCCELLFITVPGFLTAVASLVAEHRF